MASCILNVPNEVVFCLVFEGIRKKYDKVLVTIWTMPCTKCLLFKLFKESNFMWCL